MGIGDGIAAAAVRVGEGESIGAVGGFAGGRVGKWILTVSRIDEAGAGVSGCGVTVMRTVSFLGSIESAMRGRTSAKYPDRHREFCH